MEINNLLSAPTKKLGLRVFVLVAFFALHVETSNANTGNVEYLQSSEESFYQGGKKKGKKKKGKHKKGRPDCGAYG